MVGNASVIEAKGVIMLILTRKVGDSLVIGDDVSIVVLGVKGNQVRIGVNAPKEISVHREEIYNRIQREKLNELEAKHGDGQAQTSSDEGSSSFNE